MKNILILILGIILNCSYSSCQSKLDKTKLIPEWEVGQKYSYKLTYTGQGSVQKDPNKQYSIFIYQSLSILGEDDNGWTAKLEFDSFDKNGIPWDSDGDYRIFPNKLSYDLTIKKDTAEIVVINMESITAEFIEFLSPVLGEERALERIQIIKSNYDQIGIPPKDFNFIYSNNLKPLIYDSPIERDSSFNEGSTSYQEVFKRDETKNITEYKDETITNMDSRSDTINDRVRYSGVIKLTQTNLIDYNDQLIPIRSEVKTLYENTGDKSINLSSGYTSDYGPSIFLETMSVELIKVEKIDK